MHRAKLHRAKLHRAKLHRAKLHRAKLYRAKWHRAKWRKAKLHRVKLHRAKLHRVKLRRAKLHEPALQKLLHRCKGASPRLEKHMMANAWGKMLSGQSSSSCPKIREVGRCVPFLAFSKWVGAALHDVESGSEGAPDNIRW